MNSTVTITQAQAQLPKLVRDLEERGSITLERRGKIAAFLVSPERMSAIIETLEILSNKQAMDAITEYEKGKTQFKDVSCLDED